MNTLRLRRFSRPEILRAIAPDRLREFLAPYAAELSQGGFRLPADPSQPVNCLRLAEFLSDSSATLPAELIDALHLVDELATPDGLDRLVAAAEGGGRPLDPRARLTPADAAAAMWLTNRDLLRRQHDEAILRRPRSYRSFQALAFPPPAVKPVTKTQLARLTNDLDDVFESRHRGRGTDVRPAQDRSVLVFLIRHGGPYRREGRMDGRTVHYRPERYDVVRYHPQAGELQVNAASEWERQLYRTSFGRLLFGNPVFFPGLCRFTLEPLRRDGLASLACADVPGIERIVLREVHQVVGLRTVGGGDRGPVSVVVASLLASPADRVVGLVLGDGQLLDYGQRRKPLVLLRQLLRGICVDLRLDGEGCRPRTLIKLTLICLLSLKLDRPLPEPDRSWRATTRADGLLGHGSPPVVRVA